MKNYDDSCDAAALSRFQNHERTLYKSPKGTYNEVEEAEARGVKIPCSDYEECSECGFDHGYEQDEAVKAHSLIG